MRASRFVKIIAKTIAWVVTLAGCRAFAPMIWPSIFDEMPGGWFLGPFVLFLGIAGLVFLYARESVRFAAIRSRPYGMSALAVAVLANAIVFVISVPFFSVSAGEHIRPMGWFAFVLILSVSAFLVVELAAMQATLYEEPRALGILCAIGGTTPLPLSMAMLILAEAINGFTLAP
jgi:hypothetical protein